MEFKDSLNLNISFYEFPFYQFPNQQPSLNIEPRLTDTVPECRM